MDANLRLTVLNSAAAVMNYQRIQSLEMHVAESKERLDQVEGELGVQGELLRRTMHILAGVRSKMEKLQSNQEQLVALMGVIKVHLCVCFPVLTKRKGIPSIARELLILLASGVLLRITQVDAVIGMLSGIPFSVFGRRTGRMASNISRLAALVAVYVTLKPYFTNWRG